MLDSILTQAEKNGDFSNRIISFSQNEDKKTLFLDKNYFFEISLKLLIKRIRSGDAEAQLEIGKYFLNHKKPKWAVNLLEIASLYGNLEAEKCLHCLAKQSCDYLCNKAV